MLPSVGFRFNKSRSFFDRTPVVNALDRASHRVLSKFGSYVRSDARQSIRRRKRVSRPYESPTNQTGKLKRGIYFAYERRRRSVIIGPQLFPGRSSSQTLETLEYGGPAVVKKIKGKAKARYQRRNKNKRWTKPEIDRIVANKQVRGEQLGKVVSQQITIEPRPFMGPAYKANENKVPEMWRDALI